MLNKFEDLNLVNKPIIKVGELYSRIITNLKNDYYLQDILVEGEISNLYPRYLSSFDDLKGKYLYFDLKGEESRDSFNRLTLPLIHCAMWQTSSLSRDNYLPKEGDKVVVRGSVTAYKDRGQLQLTIVNIKPTGLGLLLLQLSALKDKLTKEGLFATEHKKPFPLYPFNIALLAGKGSAAQADVLNTLSKRWPLANVVFYPVPVQGKTAVSVICDTLSMVDKLNYDAIILARGGGSFEDLFYFNDEQLVRVIYGLDTFIITGIGHEVDFTLAEAVADYRAITPTDAAEKISPNYKDIISLLANYHYKLNQAIFSIYKSKKLVLVKNTIALRNFHLKIANLHNLINKHTISMGTNLKQICQNKKHHVENINVILKNNVSTQIINNNYLLGKLKDKINNQMNKILTSNKLYYKRFNTLLNAYAPSEIMKKGYTLTYQDNKLIKSFKNLDINKILKINYYDGYIKAIIKEAHDEK